MTSDFYGRFGVEDPEDGPEVTPDPIPEDHPESTEPTQTEEPKSIYQQNLGIY